jgi:hypothetical protein
MPRLVRAGGGKSILKWGLRNTSANNRKGRYASHLRVIRNVGFPLIEHPPEPEIRDPPHPQ